MPPNQSPCLCPSSVCVRTHSDEEPKSKGGEEEIGKTDEICCEKRGNGVRNRMGIDCRVLLQQFSMITILDGEQIAQQ